MSALAGFCAAYWCKSHNETLKAQRFDVLTQEAADKIRRQFQLYEFGLRGARGTIIAAGNELSRERFGRYSQTRDVKTEFPGSLGFGFIRIVPKRLIGEFLESARRDGSPDFEIRELGEHPGDHFVIQYIEPSKNNTEAIGLDIASELMRRDAALASMDSGEARLTAPLTLVQASGKSERGFLFLLPIYQAGQPIDTAEGRRAAALGWSYTPLLIDDVLAGAQFLGDELTLSLSDIRTAGSSPFYSSTVAEPVENLSRRIWLNVYGRDWELRTQASPVFLKRLNLENPVLVGIGVFLFGLLLSVVFHLHLKELRRRERDWSERSRLASMVEESSEAIVGTNLNGEVTDWNPAAEQLFGYKAAEVHGRRLESLIVPARLVPERDDALRQVFQSNSCVKLVTQRQSRDGRLMDMEVNLSPIRSETGTLVGIGTSARDITPFVKAQREIQELNQSLEKQIVARTAELNVITNAIPSMIAYWDKDLLCRFANAAYLEWFGRQPHELIGSSMVSLLGERLFAMNEPHIRAALRGEAQNFERSLVKADGTTGHTWANYVPHLNEQREVLGFFVLVTDVTPLWNAERRIEESEARYRLLADNSSDMIFQLDRDFVNRYVSPASQDILGYAEADLVGTGFTGQIHHEDLGEVDKVFELLLKGVFEHHSVTSRMRHRDGRWIWVESALRAQDPKTGKVQGVLGALRDISARKTFEMELKAAKEAAESAARTKAEFLASMSHELRTPLNSIIGFSRLIIESREPKSSTVERHTQLIHSASKTLLSIVNDVLDVSRLDANRLELDCRVFCSRLLFQHAIDLMQGETQGKDLSFRSEIGADVPEFLVGDDSRLRQILLNLISNAFKFTAKGSIVLSVASEHVSADMARLRISVADTGIGVPEAARSRLFQKFSQVDSRTARSYGGSGLGLSICKSLVELMGGYIDFKSREGVGSEFWFTVDLPIADLDAAGLGFEQDTVESKQEARATILLAEDNPLNQELAVAIIGKWGHHVDVVSNGAEAVDAVRRKDYDMVLMDIQMPVMDGVEATTRIRSLGGRYASLAIIAMTAAVLANQVEDFKEAGMSDHLGKPFEPRELRRIINYWKQARKDFAENVGGMLEANATGPCDKAGNEMIDIEVSEAAPTRPILDEKVYDVLAKVIGSEKAAQLARRFSDDLTQRFRDVSDQEMLRIDAHKVISSAGMLGFSDLSACARELERACENSDDLDNRRRSFLEARAKVGEYIVARFGT